MRNVRIHKPVPGLHTWGIEWNYELEQRCCYDAEANDFVHAMNEYIFGQPQKYWFHQCGCDPDSRRIGYRGYQMFECWAPNAHDECAKAAEFVASKIGCNVVEA